MPQLYSSRVPADLRSLPAAATAPRCRGRCGITGHPVAAAGRVWAATCTGPSARGTCAAINIILLIINNTYRPARDRGRGLVGKMNYDIRGIVIEHRDRAGPAALQFKIN